MLSGERLGAPHGGAVHTTEVARAFVELGHEVTLVSPGTLPEGLTVRHLPCEMKWGPLTSTWKARRHSKELKAFNPEIIYERQLVGGGYGGSIGREWNAQVVYEVNSPHLDEYFNRFPWLWPLAWFLRPWEKMQFDDAHLVVTTHEQLVPKNYTGKRLVGPWAVRSPETVSREPLWDVPEGTSLILCAGSFLPWHGGEWIETVLRQLPPGDWAVAFAGGGERRRHLVERLERHGLPVIDGGDLSAGEMSQAYREAHVLLAPFDPPIRKWPFYYSPFKILEALSYGLPVVTDAHENLKELMDEPWCGQVMELRDPQLWAEALSQQFDQGRATAEQGQTYAQRHSWRAHVTAILEILKA